MMSTAVKFISFISPYLDLFSLCLKTIQLLIINKTKIQDGPFINLFYESYNVYNRQMLLFSSKFVTKKSQIIEDEYSINKR